MDTSTAATMMADIAAPPRRPPLTATSRRSYFQEAPMDEYTPASSVHEEPFRERFWIEGAGKLVLRVGNAVLHLGLCCVLLVIMVEFLVRYEGHRRRLQAIALVTVVAADCCLDVYSVARLRKPWQGWAVVLRLLLALGHIAQFLVYVGFRRMFPLQYAYWGMEAEFSEPVVYLLLLALGIWNLLHVVMHRHTLGIDLRQYAGWARNRGQSRTLPTYHYDENPSRTLSRGIQQREVDHRDAGTGSDSEATIGLNDINEDDKGPRVVVTSYSGASWTSDESISQSTILADSRRDTPRTSRRESIVAADDSESVNVGADKTGLDMKI